MKLHEMLAMTLSLVQFPAMSTTVDYTLDFGVIIQSDTGEPIGFEKTRQIPINHFGKPSLYGLVVTSEKNAEFSLNSVHVLPPQEDSDVQAKVLGKPMYVQNRGAIFLRTEQNDEPGDYSIEIYIDNKLYQVINYQLTSSDALAKH